MSGGRRRRGARSNAIVFTACAALLEIAAPAGLVALAVGASAGCKGNARVLYPRKISAGRPPGCPDTGAIPLGVDSDSVISPDSARYTYGDAIGGSVLRVAGKVLAESGTAGVPDRGMPEVRVSIHKLEGPVNPDNPGKPLADSSTTAQGNYSLATPLATGRYILLVFDSTGQYLTYRTIDITDNDSGSLLNTNIVVPIDPSLRSPPTLQPNAPVPKSLAPPVKPEAGTETETASKPAAPATTAGPSSAPPGQ